jgi:hypothetical protein
MSSSSLTAQTWTLRSSAGSSAGGSGQKFMGVKDDYPAKARRRKVRNGIFFLNPLRLSAFPGDTPIRKNYFAPFALL